MDNRQLKVIELFKAGRTNREIQAELQMGPNTILRILKKAGLSGKKPVITVVTVPNSDQTVLQVNKPGQSDQELEIEQLKRILDEKIQLYEANIKERDMIIADLQHKIDVLEIDVEREKFNNREEKKILDQVSEKNYKEVDSLQEKIEVINNKLITVSLLLESIVKRLNGSHNKSIIRDIQTVIQIFKMIFEVVI